ncbi:MAG: NnrS family protein [Rhodocyclaceae bacterium]|jgi:uncharacterized protein involved in response to NO|nr:NnrS family protein [Rhodocyclaceae bacterium]
MIKRQEGVARGAVLFAAPHRGMFLLGAVQMLVVFSLWAWELAGRVGWGPGLAWPWPAAWGHGFITVFGVFPAFMFGFLLTAMPRWQSLADTPGQRARGPWWALVLGWLAFYVGWLVQASALRWGGLVLVILGWGWVCRILLPVAFAPREGGLTPERLHPMLTWLGLALGLLGVVAWLGFEVLGNGRLGYGALKIGVWWMLLPVFFTVAHRMVPFFTGSVVPNYPVVRPLWALVLVVAASFTHGLLELGGLVRWAWLADLPMALVTTWLAWSWQPWRSRVNRLLAMLHLAFVWLPAALWLGVLQGCAALLGYVAGGLAPLHALTVGFFASLVMAMVSRVTLGHSGRPLAADSRTWGLMLALNGVALLRVLADLVPKGQGVVLAAAALGMLVVVAVWALRYVPVYLKPRADGRPG